MISQASVVLALVGSFAASSPASAPDSTSWLALRVHVPKQYIRFGLRVVPTSVLWGRSIEQPPPLNPKP